MNTTSSTLLFHAGAQLGLCEWRDWCWWHLVPSDNVIVKVEKAILQEA